MQGNSKYSGTHRWHFLTFLVCIVESPEGTLIYLPMNEFYYFKAVTYKHLKGLTCLKRIDECVVYTFATVHTSSYLCWWASKPGLRGQQGIWTNHLARAKETICVLFLIKVIGLGWFSEDS